MLRGRESDFRAEATLWEIWCVLMYRPSLLDLHHWEHRYFRRVPTIHHLYQIYHFQSRRCSQAPRDRTASHWNLFKYYKSNGQDRKHRCSYLFLMHILENPCSSRQSHVKRLCQYVYMVQPVRYSWIRISVKNWHPMYTIVCTQDTWPLFSFVGNKSHHSAIMCFHFQHLQTIIIPIATWWAVYTPVIRQYTTFS